MPPKVTSRDAGGLANNVVNKSWVSCVRPERELKQS